jgi:four helix bundle protein
MSEIKGFRDLIVYQKAYKLALEIFEISKAFPKEEKYSLTDQIRRSSRSVTANIAESWAKKKYIKAFVNKLTDALGEEYETEVWMDFSKDFQYINHNTYDQVMAGYEEVRKMLISMINKPENFFR